MIDYLRLRYNFILYPVFMFYFDMLWMYLGLVFQYHFILKIKKNTHPTHHNTATFFI